MKALRLAIALVAFCFLPAAAAAAAAAGAGEPQAVDLRVRLKPGEYFRFSVELEKSTEMDTAQGKAASRDSAAGVYVARALGTDDRGNCRLEIFTESLRVDIGGYFAYDSAKEADKPKEETLIGSYFALLASARYTAAVDPRGRATAFAGLEEIDRRMKELFPNTGIPPSYIGGRGLAEKLCLLFWEPLPADKKQPGETWALEEGAGEGPRLKVTRKLQAVADGVATIPSSRPGSRWSSRSPPPGRSPTRAPSS